MSQMAEQLISAETSPGRSAGPMQLTREDGVIIVGNLLPVTIRRIVVDGRIDFDVQWNHDSLLSMKTKQMEGLRVMWVGGVHIATDGHGGGGLFDASGEIGQVDDMEETTLVQRLLQFNCVPVLEKPETMVAHHEYCKSSLFPMFHSIVDIHSPGIPQPTSTAGSPRARSSSPWESYVRVNKAFANKVVELYQEGDLVWVHNYQLMLTPSYLLREIPGVTICFYMHQPWPSSELFRTLTRREEILRGMLNSDIIGFHSFDFARNFLTACSRLLGLGYSVKKGGNLTLDYNGRHIEIFIEHVAIEPDMLAEQLHQPEVRLATERYTSQFQGKRLILAIDDLFRLSGIALKLLAYEELLDECPHLGKNTVLLQIGVENFYERSEDFEMVCRECAEICDRINSKHGAAVIYKRVPTLPTVDRLSLMSIADVFINSVVRSGLNLRPFEYVFVNKKKGVVLMSEYNCGVRALSGCVCINPFHTSDTKDQIQLALRMPDSERSIRHDRDLLYTTTHATSQWALNILTEMKRISRQDDGANFSYVGYGMGLKFRVLRVRADFQKLDTRKVMQKYRLCERRLFLLDYGGTLVSDGTIRTPQSNFWSGAGMRTLDAGLSEEHCKMLNELAEDQRNVVVIVSGRSRSNMKKFCAGLSPKIGLAAELGYYLRPPQGLAAPSAATANDFGGMFGEAEGVEDSPRSEGSTSTDGGEWEVVASPKILNVHDAWREVTVSIMDQYRKRTQGSRVEPKQTSVTFSYRESDPDYGKLQAAELKSHLEGILIRQAQFPVVTVSGDKYLEVRLKGVNKGECLLAMVRRMAESTLGPPDFAVAMGNDDHDENMYAAMHALDGTIQESETDGWFNCLKEPGRLMPQVREGFGGFSTIVGRKASTARYYLEDVDEAWELIRALNLAGKAAQQNQSMVDLRSLGERDSDTSPRAGLAGGGGAGLTAFGRIRTTQSRERSGTLPMGGAGGGMSRGLGDYRTSVGDLASLGSAEPEPFAG